MSKKKPAAKRDHKAKANVKPEKTACDSSVDAVTSESNQEAAGMPPVAPPAAPARSQKHMDVTLTLNKEPRKSQRIVIFNGPLNSVQFLRTAFGETIPETIVVSGDFAEPKAKVAKINETKEERKARLAALPKLTLAEKVARAEKRTEELKAKLAKAAPAAAPAAL